MCIFVAILHPMVRFAIILCLLVVQQFPCLAHTLIPSVTKPSNEVIFTKATERTDSYTNSPESSQAPEKESFQNILSTKYALAIISFLFLSLLVASIHITIRFRNRTKKLAKANKQLKDKNSHLETVVELRTQDLLETQKQAQENSKQKSTFLANISHEIRTPLNAILGFTKLLDHDNLNKTERKQYVDIITRRGKILQQTVNDIINLSLIDAGMLYIKTEPFNLNQLLYDLYKMFKSNSLYCKNPQVKFRLTVSMSDERSTILSDPSKVEQIINNLLTNAFAYTNEGVIEFGYELTPYNQIKFFVKDTGSGISQSEREQVYSNAKRIRQDSEDFKTHGLGLGLPICKGLTDLLGGKLNIETITNEGTTVYFAIPYIPGKQKTTSYISRSSVQSLSLNNKLILVVEDDLISFQLIEAMLDNTGAKLIHAKNGEDAIEIAKLKGDIDLIIMDMRLPFVDGYEATQAIKKFNPEIPIIAQTANTMGYDRDKCIKAGCDDYVPKPIDPDVFLRAVANFLPIG